MVFVLVLRSHFPGGETMSLSSAMNVASLGMRAAEIGVHTAGQNLANSNTPDYVRSRVVLETGPTYALNTRMATGTGVVVEGVKQVVDQYLMQRMRDAGSDVADSATDAYYRSSVETIIGELTESDISSLMNDFFGSINGVLNQPEDLSVRQNVAMRGRGLAELIQNKERQTMELFNDADKRVGDMVPEMNEKIQTISELNQKIAGIELVDGSGSDAVGLRDQRDTAIRELSEIINIDVVQADGGVVNVYCDDGYLVYNGETREVMAKEVETNGLVGTQIVFTHDKQPLQPRAGELAGLLEARDETIAGFYNELDDYAKTLIYEFNKIFSGGQGLNGYSELTSEFSVDEPEEALNKAGLPFTPETGSFKVLVTNNVTGDTTEETIDINLTGLGEQASMQDLVDNRMSTFYNLAEDLNDIEGITASINLQNQLVIEADSEDLEFAFADDTSGVLAAMGINTFFSGIGSGDIGINDYISDDPSKFAASSGGIGQDTENAIKLAGFPDTELASKGDVSIATFYETMVVTIAMGSNTAAIQSESDAIYYETLVGEHQSISGVNVDEETLNLLDFQKMYQANARVVSTVQTLLDVLLNLGR